MFLNSSKLTPVPSQNRPFNKSSKKLPKRTLNDSDSSESLKQSKFAKTIETLDQLGFVSSSTNRPLLTETFQQGCKKKYSIGIADFWTFQDKLKYLKNKGYWEAYKKLLYQKHVLQYTYKKSARNPNLPYVMDHNAVRTVKSRKREERKVTSRVKNIGDRLSKDLGKTSRTPDGGRISPMVEKLEGLQDMCVKTVSESNKEIEVVNRKLRKTLGGLVSSQSSTPVRLIRRDRIKIKEIIKRLMD